MASPSTVITLGYGSFGSVNLLPTLGYGQGGTSSTTPTAVFAIDYAADYFVKRNAEFAIKVAPDFSVDENQ